MENEVIKEDDKSGIRFIDSLYDSIYAIKEGYKLYPIIFLLSFSLKAASVYYYNVTDDTTLIINALVAVVGNILQGVLILNFFYFSYKNESFKISKVLWDIPTYTFFLMLTSILILLGSCLLLLPGLYVAYTYGYVSMTAILFDEEDKSSFKLTKKAVSKLGGTYALFVLFYIIVSGITMAIVSLAPGAGIPMAITLIFCLIVTLVQDVLTGVAVSLFKKVL